MQQRFVLADQSSMMKLYQRTRQLLSYFSRCAYKCVLQDAPNDEALIDTSSDHDDANDVSDGSG